MRLPFSARSLSYADAVKLLVPGESPIVSAVGRLGGLAAAGVTVATVGTVDFFALRDQLVSWGHEIAGSVRERITGVSRFDRTERLVAAHSVLVVTAFYEALDEALARHPRIDPKDFRLTAAEQVALSTGGWPGTNYRRLVHALIGTPPPIPSPDRPFEVVLGEIENHYVDISDSLMVFLPGLAAFEHHGRDVASAVTDDVHELAVRRYLEGYRRLAVDAPEFGVWVSLLDSQATRATFRGWAAELHTRIDELRSQVADAGRILAGMTTGAAAEARRADLATRYRRRLGRRILDSAAMPAHVVMPSLGEAYINPRCRVATVGRDGQPAQEKWWADQYPIDDLEGFVRAHLTTVQAVSAPLVVLGQPGSGKSVLTRILAARLPETDFMVVRVELRGVPADASVQDQLQEALYQEIGERVSWPDLARGAGDALPVVLLDGFDELLQATGLNQSDYLMRVRDFQEREADLGRPVAVVVTSRTVVADRARFPERTVAVRLEPFDEARVRRWLEVWNAANAASLSARSLQPLTAHVALSYPELADQPLLLLLLALYDSGANALQHSAGRLGKVELYEQLFADFIDREIDKNGSDLTDEQRAEEVAREWRRLTVVAIAILNRSGDVITETELNDDIPYLLDPNDLPQPERMTINRALTPGQFLVGRFFFIHDSQATRDVGAPEKSFEFLHATFGDFLAARLIVEALTELADDRDHRRNRRQPAQLDAGFFHATMSFATVTRRAPLREFCSAMLDGLDGDLRTRCRELVLELLPDAGFPHPTWSLADYEPHRRTVAARHAAFSANLVWLAVALSDGPVPVRELFGADLWRDHALLWQSQLSGADFESLWQSLRVENDSSSLRVWHDDSGTVSVHRSLAWAPMPISATYPDLVLASESPTGSIVRQAAFVQDTGSLAALIDMVIPFWRTMDSSMLIRTPTTLRAVHTGRVLMELLLQPAEDQSAQHRLEIFSDALEIAQYFVHGQRYGQLVLRQLAEDIDALPVDGVVNLLGKVDLISGDGFDHVLDVVAAIAARTTPDEQSVVNLMSSMRYRFPPLGNAAAADDRSFVAAVDRAFAARGLPSPFPEGTE